MISLYKTGKTYAEISQQLPLRSKASVHYKLSYIFNTRKQDRDSLHKVTLVKGLVKRAQKEKWQAWETDLLVSLRETGKTYKAISQQLPGRSEAACFEKLMMGHIESKNWEAWEEELLISLYKRGNSLGEISQQMPSRSGESCRRRLLCLLKSGKQDRVEIPGNGQLWKDWEDQLIITHHDAGKSWAEISKLLPSRKETSVMKRWRKHLKPGERRNTRWSQAEDQLLTTLHNAHRGPEGWTKVAQKMPNRSEASCKNHWSKLLRCDPDLAKGVNFENRWTKLEREKVVSLVNAIGPRWYEIAKELPGRTEGACHSAYAKFCAEESGPSREYWLRSWDGK